MEREAWLLLQARWRIEMLGRLRAVQSGGPVVERFRTRQAGTLLAYLAFYSHRSHTRDALADLLWPDVEPDAARQSLRQALASLRRQMEPPGQEGTVLETGRLEVRLRPDAFTSDVAEFSATLHPAQGTDRTAYLTAACTLYTGDLLPGRDEEWILNERARLTDAYHAALQELVDSLRTAGDRSGALAFARRAVLADPLREEGQAEVLRLLAETGRSEEALDQFRLYEERLKAVTGDSPSYSLRLLMRGIAESAKRQPAMMQPGKTPAPLPVLPANVPRVDEAETYLRLPVPLTRFFGREAERNRLRTLLIRDKQRLVTLLGPGGSGKTRLAIEAAREMVPDFPGGVVFVPLADLREGERLDEAIAGALGLLRDGEGLMPRERLCTWLRTRQATKQTLLLLDNVEQVVDAVGSRLERLLEDAPTLTCLVTSRRPLLITGEQEIEVSPLPLPQEALSPEALDANPAARLFVDRVRAVRPDFGITVRNAAEVSALCILLEGIPLALELAATHARTCTLAQMLSRISEDRFGLLRRRGEVGTSRHRSLTAALSWSYDLLLPELQQVFRRLSVFRGGWTGEAAAAVTDQEDIYPVLERLVEYSLVQVQSGTIYPCETRYHLLETGREFAGEQMQPAEQEETTARHTAYFLRLAETAAWETTSRPQDEVARLQAEDTNFRAVFDRCRQGLREGDTVRLRLSAALLPYWTRGYAWEGLAERLAGAVASPATDSPPETSDTATTSARFRILLWLTQHHTDVRGDFLTAEACLCQAEKIADALGTADYRMRTLLNRANLLSRRNDSASAKPFAEEMLHLAETTGDLTRKAHALNLLATIAWKGGDALAARRYLEDSIAVGKNAEAGSETPRIHPQWWNLGCLALYSDDFEEASRYFERGAADAAEAADIRFGQQCLSYLGMTLLSLGAWERAQTVLKACCDAPSCLPENEYVHLPLAMAYLAQDGNPNGQDKARACLHRVDARRMSSPVARSILLYTLGLYRASSEPDPTAALVLSRFWGAAEAVRSGEEEEFTLMALRPFLEQQERRAYAALRLASDTEEEARQQFDEARLQGPHLCAEQEYVKVGLFTAPP
jgi:predicted ATPase/DNA-binding SARP family transcriptional activator